MHTDTYIIYMYFVSLTQTKMGKLGPRAKIIAYFKALPSSFK